MHYSDVILTPSGDTFGTSSTPFIIQGIDCPYNVSALSKCTHGGWGNVDQATCATRKTHLDAGVIVKVQRTVVVVCDEGKYTT